MATRPILVTFLRRKTPYFDDETYSLHHFETENALFRRRDLFSSPFCGVKLLFLATRPLSRHHFVAGNSIF
ncbi:hypothetical protein LIZ76_03040 [Caldibacillus sp. 210928-DFI.2.22]|uniref:hypothetical protein n=1 Tax=Caldibacillus sp. 210928-DFI.2.22 TaxID=2883265 RepID=UPI001D09746A|nr:hypothetical protein [Caldibacillus sp. 210928-DFI.2.22]MCB7068943.1 hypothetical protein [Caldibacillus sp. 210928-DFI.2.22]